MDLMSIVKVEEIAPTDRDDPHAEVSEFRQLAVKQEPPDICPLTFGRNGFDPFQGLREGVFSSYVGANSSESLQKAERKATDPCLNALRRPRNGIPGIVIESPDWLPTGWVTEMKTRESGLSAGTTDKYYIDPVTRHRFRSKAEVLRFLETGQIARARRKSIPVMSVPPLNLIKPDDVTPKSSDAEPAFVGTCPGGASSGGASNLQPPRELCSCSKPVVYYRPVACYSPLYAAYPGLYPVVFLPVIENEGNSAHEQFKFPPPELLQNMQLQPIYPWPCTAHPSVSSPHFPFGPGVASAFNQFHTNAHPNNAHGHVNFSPSHCRGSCGRSDAVQKGRERVYSAHGSSFQVPNQHRNLNSSEYLGNKKRRPDVTSAGLDAAQFSFGACSAKDNIVHSFTEVGTSLSSSAVSGLNRYGLASDGISQLRECHRYVDNPLAAKSNYASDSESLRTATSIVDHCRPSSVSQHRTPTTTSRQHPGETRSVLLEQQIQIPRMRGHVASLASNWCNRSLGTAALASSWSSGYVP